MYICYLLCSYEFVNNFKVLQAVFAKNNIQKFIDVPRLVIAKYQDNLEFFQWMKRFFDLHYNGQEYDAVGRRLAACPNAESNPFFVQGTAKINPVKPRRTAATPALGSGQVCMAPGNTVADRMVENTQTNSSSVSRKLAPLNSKPTPSSTALSKASPVGSVSDSKVVEMTEQLTEMKLTVDGLEKERDFYFGKLRDIEILCQTLENQDTPIIQEIQRILYAAEDDFAAVDEQGQTFNNKENNEMVTA